MSNPAGSPSGHMAVTPQELQSLIATENSTVIDAINLLIKAVETRRSEYEQSAQKDEPEFISASDICTRLSIARSTINKWQQDRNFPLPVKIGNYCNRWRKAEVDSWVAQNF
ncbi:MAG: helix-turn-helix transcriptional regulator [Rubripirellula sp.]